IAALQSIEKPKTGDGLLKSCEDSVLRANSQLRKISRERGGDVIGTTLAALLTFGDYYACIWCGDSRIYRIRSGNIAQLSQDHTEVQQLLSSGVITAEEAKDWAGSNVITRAIGVYDEPELELDLGE